jgi:DNA processing protein
MKEKRKDVDEVVDLLQTTFLPGVTPRMARALRARGCLAAVLAHPRDHADLLPPPALADLERGRARRRAEDELRKAAAIGVSLTGLDHPDYPALLRETHDPPLVLYVVGRLPATPLAVSIVGSRKATVGGRAFARSLARDLAAAGVVVVSGLARGIDSEAHRGALDGKGATIAVLGSALDRVYPGEHAGLAREIAAQGGAVVSEFPLGTGPRPDHFPRRNRVIAGLSRAVVVVEAAERSGALGTAALAADEGRDVLAVPGHPTEPLAAGTNALLRDGALLARSAADVAEALGLVIGVTNAIAPSGDHILDSLRPDRPTSLEELVSLCGRPVGELLSHLSVLEIDARVRRLPGPAFVRA